MIQLILIILAAALEVLRQTNVAGASDAAKISDELIKIIRAGARAHELQTGQPLDPALIKPEGPI